MDSTLILSSFESRSLRTDLLIETVLTGTLHCCCFFRERDMMDTGAMQFTHLLTYLLAEAFVFSSKHRPLMNCFHPWQYNIHYSIVLTHEPAGAIYDAKML